ncbi:MAG: hypothetical protein JOZ77_08880 [Candidatus Eremiobacteraeota bacterium]|nr:hypothetical protein [Candidatus Eremiobacteraeota bacterium]
MIGLFLARTALAACAVVAVFTAAQASPASVPTIVRRASTVYAAEMRGFVGLERHFTTQLHGGPFQHGEQSDSGQLFQDGKFVQVSYYRVVRDGRQFSPSQIAQRNDQTNKDWAAGRVFFKEPYDPRYVGDYTFAQAACSGCAAGSQRIAFTSTIRDAQHGDGAMDIDVATGHILRLTYVPNALPPHATSGSVTETGGEVLPHLWYVARISQTFSGRAFLLSGTGTFTGVFDHFRRLPSLLAGQTALANQTI